jgi:hypothetical protein
MESIDTPILADTVMKHRLSLSQIFSLFFLLLLLIGVPVSVIIIGERTRTQIKADVACNQPAVPNPKDCVGGTWKLYTDVNNCVKFRCVLGQ